MLALRRRFGFTTPDHLELLFHMQEPDGDRVGELLESIVEALRAIETPSIAIETPSIEAEQGSSEQPSLVQLVLSDLESADQSEEHHAMRKQVHAPNAAVVIEHLSSILREQAEEHRTSHPLAQLAAGTHEQRLTRGSETELKDPCCGMLTPRREP
jgi:hypothetical protein